MPLRSREYLEYVRSLGCVICGAPSEPHHWRKGADGGVALKPSDCFAIPLCHEHHMEAHDHGERTFAEKFNFDPWRTIAFTTKGFLAGAKATIGELDETEANDR